MDQAKSWSRGLDCLAVLRIMQERMALEDVSKGGVGDGGEEQRGKHRKKEILPFSSFSPPFRTSHQPSPPKPLSRELEKLVCGRRGRGRLIWKLTTGTSQEKSGGTRTDNAQVLRRNSEFL